MSKLFAKTWLATAALVDRARREDGQALTEYALILGLITAVGVAVLATIGSRIGVRLNNIANLLPGS